MAELGACSQCSGDVTADSDFCPHCGLLLEAAGVQQCEMHPDKDARGVCIICHSLVCRRCSKRVMGRMFCSDHKEVEVVQDWANAFESTETHEADLARSILESCGVSVQLQNAQSIGFIWGAGSESAISRSQINKPVKVFVPIPDYLRALQQLAEWKSGDDGSDRSSGTASE